MEIIQNKTAYLGCACKNERIQSGVWVTNQSFIWVWRCWKQITDSILAKWHTKSGQNLLMLIWCWWIGWFLTPFWALHHVRTIRYLLRLQQKTVRHQQIKKVYSERILFF